MSRVKLRTRIKNRIKSVFSRNKDNKDNDIDELNFDPALLESIKNLHQKSMNGTKDSLKIIKELDSLIDNLEQEVEESVHAEQKIMSVYKTKCDSLNAIHLDLNKINEDIFELNRLVKTFTEEAHDFAIDKVQRTSGNTAKHSNEFIEDKVKNFKNILKDIKSNFDDMEKKINEFATDKAPLNDNEQRLLNELMSQKTDTIFQKSKNEFDNISDLINDIDREVKTVTKRGFINT
ncbi:hypothetical protein CMO95_00275 [Candidatus Woesearchaeota archaeon]|nr:hypothetical protein [Candidatus Woesearchaeota archaeon]|tara:strand:+ start:1058 stop:1759 length:702 start_codon:yes stop_codon:yes gene_type:complete